MSRCSWLSWWHYTPPRDDPLNSENESTYHQNMCVCVCVCKGVTLHSGLYSHLRPGSRSWPIKFSCLTPWLHWKFGFDPRLFSINHTHREALTFSKLAPTICLTTWPASKFGLDRLTSLWPRSRVGVQSPMQCHPLGVCVCVCAVYRWWQKL